MAGRIEAEDRQVVNRRGLHKPRDVCLQASSELTSEYTYRAACVERGVAIRDTLIEPD